MNKLKIIIGWFFGWCMLVKEVVFGDNFAAGFMWAIIVQGIIGFIITFIPDKKEDSEEA